MTKRVAVLLVVAAVAVAAVAALSWWALGRRAPAAGEADEEVAPGHSVTFELYFPGKGGYLVPEERELAVTSEPQSRARAIVLALLDGPRQADLYRPFPEDVVLLDLYLEADGTAYVDLGQQGSDRPPSGGSLAEMMRVYSVVDSLVYDVPEVRRVALLWNGVQRETFSGHLDTSVPLLPERDLVAASPEGAGAGSTEP